MKDEFEEFAFVGEGKETFTDRLNELLRGRSVRAAAKDWGLSVSTLNNYLTKGTEPSFKMVQSVANKERVSLDWLAYGASSPTKERHSSAVPDTRTENKNPDLEYAWKLVYNSLEQEDVVKLMKAIHKRGVEGLLSNQMWPNNFGPVDLNELSIVLSRRPALAQAINLALSGNDDTDREILQIAKNATHADLPDTQQVDQAEKSKAVG